MTTTKKNRRATPSNVKLTREEQQIEDSAAEFEAYPLDRARIQAAARATLRKDARTNIRLMRSTLAGLKMQAARDGLPYQTLIASVLHRYVTGRLKEVQE